VDYRASQVTEMTMEATTRHHHSNNGSRVVMKPITVATNSDTGFQLQGGDKFLLGAFSRITRIAYVGIGRKTHVWCLQDMCEWEFLQTMR